MTVSTQDIKTAQSDVLTKQLSSVQAQTALQASRGALQALQAQKAIDDFNAQQSPQS